MVGRPLKFKSVEDLEKQIDSYFAQCDPKVIEVTEYVQARDKSGALLKDENGHNYLVEITHKAKTEPIPYTITGLALHLDTSRETLLDYEKGKYDDGESIEGYDPQYSDTIKKAKVKIEAYNERMLYESRSPIGTIFNLKNNYGWKDKTEQDVTTGGKPLKALVEFVGDDGNPDKG